MKKGIIKKITGAAIHHAPDIAQIGLEFAKKKMNIESKEEPKANNTENLEIILAQQKEIETLKNSNKEFSKQLKEQSARLTELERKLVLADKKVKIGYIAFILACCAFIIAIIR